MSANERVIGEGIRRFEALLEKNGYESYDPYDVWGTKYGVFSRRIYYEKGKVGLPLIAPILLLEMACPGLRGLFVRKERFATADGQLTLAFLNLYQITKDKKFLEKARRLGEDMLKYSVPGYSGQMLGLSVRLAEQSRAVEEKHAVHHLHAVLFRGVSRALRCDGRAALSRHRALDCDFCLHRFEGHAHRPGRCGGELFADGRNEGRQCQRVSRVGACSRRMRGSICRNTTRRRSGI